MFEAQTVRHKALKPCRKGHVELAVLATWLHVVFVTATRKLHRQRKAKQKILHWTFGKLLQLS